MSYHSCLHSMPKVRRSRKPPPEGWELIEPTLDELDQKMREAETETHEGKRKVESLWPIFRIHHQKSRYIFELFYKRKAISRELYEYCLKENIADKNLIAKWKKQGYENLCCLRCIQTRDTNFGANCVCRVPKPKLQEGKIVECVNCGCRGCSGWWLQVIPDQYAQWTDIHIKVALQIAVSVDSFPSLGYRFSHSKCKPFNVINSSITLTVNMDMSRNEFFSQFLPSQWMCDGKM